MPLLRRWPWKLVSGRYGTCERMSAAPELFQFATVMPYDGLAVPLSVSYRPSMRGLFHVWPSGSGAFFGKS